MLETVILILVVLWLLGFYVMNMGTLVHILLVLAVVALVMRLFRGRSSRI